MIADMRRLLIACIAIVAGAIPAMAQDASDVTSSYETVKVADGIWMDIRKFADELTAGIASRKRNFEEYFATPVVETVYKQIKGQPTTESPFGQ